MVKKISWAISLLFLCMFCDVLIGCSVLNIDNELEASIDDNCDIQALSYKPLGDLDEGYLCITDDDGNDIMGSYTLPMIIEKGVPITFCIMKGSLVLQNPAYVQLLKKAIEVNGCSIAQHGGKEWTEYNEQQLLDFFASEKVFFNSIGLEPKGAAIPSHKTSYLIESIAGRLFGVVRCGYWGQDSKGNANYHTIFDSNITGYSISTPRSNLYCLSSANIRDFSLSTWKTIIDYAIANKRLMIIHFHDVDFGENADNYKNNRAILEGLIDYSKSSGIKMITLGDIPYLKKVKE